MMPTEPASGADTGRSSISRLDDEDLTNSRPHPPQATEVMRAWDRRAEAGARRPAPTDSWIAISRRPRPRRVDA